MAPVIGHGDIHRTLRERFGLDRFLPGQERIITALLAGRDALAVLPTGGGKSLVYQLTSQHLDGVTVVVSPLPALMKDQIKAVDEIGVRASVVNSALTEREAEDELDDLRAGRAHLLYVTPERFDDEEFMDELRRARVALFVVDEAHCVSKWGHRFRPSYLTLCHAQEAGRAGRDGAFARCLLLYRPGDLSKAAFLAGSGHLTADDLVAARALLTAHPNATLRDLEDADALSKGDLARAIGLLARPGVVEERRGRVRLQAPDFDPAAISLAQEEYRKAYEKSRVEMMRGCAETPDCRRRYFLNYFGEEYEAGACGHCDNDAAQAARVALGEAPLAAPDPDAPFPRGARVAHRAWGAGVVQRVAGATITVLFDKAGYKTLDSALVREQGLLTRA